MSMKHPSALSAAPEISVIVPIYNVADHVGSCIASLLGQTFTDFEVLMIDDGATDDSAARAQAVAGNDPRFHLISQENGGLSAARNTGLEAARGAYIAFVDSDDRVMPDYLMQLWQALQDSGADWVACGLQECFVDGSGLTHSAIHGAKDLTMHPVTRRYRLETWNDVIVHFPSAWNKLYRRSLIEGLRFDVGTWFEDHTFFYRAASRSDHLLHLPQALYLQTRGRVGQITASDDDRIFDQFPVLHEMRALMQDSEKPGAETAFAAIASRLLFERSTALHDPARRARFTDAAALFMQEEGLTYTPDWDEDISRAWGLEMAGQLPLSVILTWDGTKAEALLESLSSLAAQHGPGHEVLLVCEGDKAAKAAQEIAAPHVQVLTQKGHGAGHARACGVAAAQGRYLTFLDAGDTLHPGALLAWTEAMLRSDAVLGVSPVGQAGAGVEAPVYHPAFADPRLLPGGIDLMVSDIPLSPVQALGLELDLAGKIFDRAALQNAELTGKRPLASGPAVSLAAALTSKGVAHTPWAGITRALPKHAPFSTVWRGHDALCRGLPRALAQQLPKGWQRRLYARALWRQLNPTSPLAPRPRLIKQAPQLLRAAAAAALRGLSHGGSGPAGFDPMIGPRFLALLDPMRAARAIWRRARGRPAFAGDTPPALPVLPRSAARSTLPESHPALMLFPLQKAGLFRFQLDFHESPYGNITFFGPDRTHVPFHLSLRFEEGLAVCNDSRADGNWRAERQRVHPLPRQGAVLTIEFIPPRVRVLLGAEVLFDIGARNFLHRQGLRGVESIAYLHVEGAVQPLDLMPQAPEGGLILDPRLVLRAVGKVTDHHLHATPETVTAPALTPAAAVNGQAALQALLPGRIWRDLPPEATIVLQLNDPEGVLCSAALHLTRADMANRIETLLAQDPSVADSTLVLTLIEHIRHGALMPLLSLQAQSDARALARQFDLSDFLEPPDSPTTNAQVAPPVKLLPDQTASLIQTAVARFALSQRQTPPADPLRVVADIALPPTARQGFFLALSEPFCRAGQDFHALSQMARAEKLPPFTPSQDRWSNSAMAPYLMAEGRIAELRSLLRALAEPGAGWVVTPALAWVGRETMNAVGLPNEDREAILDAVMQFVSHRSANYWERTHCAELTRMATQLLCNREALSNSFYRKAIAFCLSAYALSRQFWQMLEAECDSAQPLPPEIIQARAAFADLQASQPAQTPADRQRIDAALRQLEALGAQDVLRVRRELLGPAGLPQAVDAPLEIEALMHLPIPATQSSGRAALRHMAAPCSSPVSDEVGTLVAQTVADLYPDLPRASQPDLQVALAQQIASFTADPTAPPADFPALLTRLDRLADPSARFLGLGLGLTLVTIWGQAQPELAQRLAIWAAARIKGLGPDHSTAFDQATAPRMAWIKLQASGLPQAEILQGFFENSPLPKLPVETVLKAENPLYDTIVTVFSCAPYLETRIPALRDGWLGLLKDLGIPYVIIVGNGDGRLEGDVLHLDAPDDYEGLPHKTLATIAWVRDHSDFAHMYKIDDDCFVNAPLLFNSLNYRASDYYGRKLRRGLAQTDRVWHQQKSAADRGKFDLDKSPEPSSYADGGSGYALSRHAIDAALDAAQSPEGQRLIETSFMEDKLLGDLLSLRGIHVDDTDYRTTIRRRSFGAATPVAFWQNSFMPSKSAPVMQAHMDTHEGQHEALARLDRHGLWPRKIWPSYQHVTLGYQSNALELITSEASVAAAAKAEVAVVACMRNEMFMLPHFLAHYRKLGVTAFLIVDNVSDDGTREYLAEQPDVALFSVDTDYKLSRYGVAWQQAMMAAVRPGKWSLVADADELLVWQDDQRESLPELLASDAFEDVDAARLFMLDMYPEGQLETANFASGDPFAEAGFCDRTPFLSTWHGCGPFSNMPTWTSALRHRLIQGARPDLFVAQKIALLRYRPWMRLSAGLHFVGDVTLSKRELIFGHFKYNADFRRKARAEVTRRQHFNDAEEYRKYLALTSEGRDRIFDPDLSVAWRDSPFVQSVLRSDNRA
ncbi:glycosyltransferase [Sulfitobacter sp. D7]|uniref:glycosyltransferase n=1 Tax=Sulfitobacter sp. D7 TaxID=1968541 RepID=UPI000E773FB3|nr:glycosyltransferase [Sulfitobacter sp. D7]AYE88245.1 hypothetical protein B5M07_18710 [Sulfitobacter sp. D7]